MHQRSERLARNIQRALAQELQQLFPGEYMTITKVEVTDDSKFATVWVSVLDESRRHEVFAQVEAQHKTLRKAITKNTHIRRLPQIALKLDESALHAQRVVDLLGEDEQA